MTVPHIKFLSAIMENIWPLVLKETPSTYLMLNTEDRRTEFQLSHHQLYCNGILNDKFYATSTRKEKSEKMIKSRTLISTFYSQPFELTWGRLLFTSNF